jgi:hypothetical protein
VVVRKERFYLLDHHHLVRALYDALHKERGDDICVYVKVMANASTLENVYFWKTMHQQNCVYLFDHAGGGPSSRRRFPRTSRTSDPMPTAAWRGSSAMTTVTVKAP